MYKKYIRPQLFKKDTEEAHDCALRWLKRAERVTVLTSFLRGLCSIEHRRLKQRLFGITFPNPVGTAAGMDKNADAMIGFEALGFGFLEIGGVTQLIQGGNAKPRVFRLVEDEAIINRMGFNNIGADALAEKLSRRSHEQIPLIPLGINLGKSKLTIEDIEAVANDYRHSFTALSEYGDFFTINVSPPNTPNLRDLQNVSLLKQILETLSYVNHRVKPLLIKVAPDLADDDLKALVELISKYGHGIIATNTTVGRPETLRSPYAAEGGGLSGKPLKERSTKVVALIHKENPTLPIVGVGGIFSGADAWEKIQAGASLIQIYTGLVYEGPALPRNINLHLQDVLIKADLQMSTLHPRVNRD